MKTKKRSLKPYSILVAEHIIETIKVSRSEFLSSCSEDRAWDTYIKGLDMVLDDIHELENVIERLRQLAVNNRPLPF